MASFGQLRLTTRGVQAQLHAMANNTHVEFTKIGIGSGVFTGDPATLTNLVKEEMLIGISDAYVQDNLFFVEGSFSNDTLEKSFIWREIGLYFKDASGKNVLYCYANAGNRYDDIPAIVDDRYVKNIRIATAFSDAEHVTIQFDYGTSMVGMDDYEEWQREVTQKHTAYDAHVESKENPHGVTAEQLKAVSQMATYYAAGATAKSADELLDSLALIPLSTTVNSQLYGILGGTYAYVMTLFYSAKDLTARRAQIAISYDAKPTKMAFRNYGYDGWIDWQSVANAAECFMAAGGTLTGQVNSKTSQSIPFIFTRSDKAASDVSWYQDLQFLTSDAIRVSALRSQVKSSGDRSAVLGVSNAANVAPSGIEVIRNAAEDYVYAKAPTNTHPWTSQICNMYAGTVSLTAGVGSLENNTVYQMYE